MLKPFLAALSDRVLVCDGAMGTMLYGKGVFINRCFESLNLSDPDMVRDVHRQYLRAGADVIETNTFGANRMKLRAFGLGNRVAELNEAAARLAREVRDRRTAGGGVRGRRHRAARRARRALGQDRRRRSRGPVPRAGRGAARGRRRSVHARDLPRSQRDRRRDRGRPRGLRPADRRADDHRGRRQQPRRHAAGAVRTGPGRARRRRRRPQLQRGPGADARDHRADGGGRRRAARGPAQRRQAARHRGPQPLPVLARVHGLLRAALRRQRRAARRRLLRHHARAHPADSPGGEGDGARTGAAGRRRA